MSNLFFSLSRHFSHSAAANCLSELIVYQFFVGGTPTIIQPVMMHLPRVLELLALLRLFCQDYGVMVLFFLLCEHSH